jgi:hypothetical protein
MYEVSGRQSCDIQYTRGIVNTALKEHKYMRTFLTDVLTTRYEIKNKDRKVLSDL